MNSIIQQAESTREKLRLTQKQMAKHMCVTNFTYNRWIRGKYRLSPKTARLFEFVLEKLEREELS